MSIIHVVSVSGGKDSAATLLLAIERFGAENVRGIFCDTGNEHEEVYKYLEYLELATGVVIATLRADFTGEIARKRMFIARDQRTRRGADGRKVRWTNKAKRRALAVLHPSGNPFLDLCLWKGRFPSRKAQFCTEELKRNMAVEYQLGLMEQGYTVVSWQGVRRDESQNRRNAKKFERVGGGLYIFRPLVEWSAMDVFAYCASKGVQPNPLYKQGMGRVGCMPCINANKAELKQIALRFPEHPERISQWEWKVLNASKRGGATFIPAENGGKFVQNSLAHAKENDIYAVIEWAQTSRGGKQFSLLTALDDGTACASAYGLCE
ncbi:phosphoadenosine phosphosulfate reductase family protein [Massilia sp. CCM 8734]|uniref:phosphoadenosine phosphosulfate reductase domain-containing protein n=1 Tax=Massilia sp. CCM 8734 TaxID=2609283 RepID=UPI0014204F90|nr:phosphoadenosine phosphosulfate reductase family protein [Massilia sp. CCM 8734]NHZ94582.1 phosphoadenosine phosphosulfate reductase family protein [Massilia sp. CCM 8734]